jgi:hypothetical protein
MQKEEILAEIKRTAKENGDKSPSKNLFERRTGVKTYEWQKFWSRWSEALQEAGFIPNQFPTESCYSDDCLIESIIDLTRELRRFPVKTEIRIKKRSDTVFPNYDTLMRRFGNKSNLILQVLNYCRDKTEYDDIIEMLESVDFVPKPNAADTVNKNNVRYGFVYLVKGHPGEYKIGRTNLVDRRLSELGATASIEQKLVHEIKTDDPVGVEAYWHKRFQDKRMKGEWFKLNAAEVNSFRKWRRIY